MNLVIRICSDDCIRTSGFTVNRKTLIG